MQALENCQVKLGYGQYLKHFSGDDISETFFGYDVCLTCRLAKGMRRHRTGPSASYKLHRCQTAHHSGWRPASGPRCRSENRTRDKGVTSFCIIRRQKPKSRKLTGGLYPRNHDSDIGKCTHGINWFLLTPNRASLRRVKISFPHQSKRDRYLHLANVRPLVVEAFEERSNTEEAPHPAVHEVSDAFPVGRESDLSPFGEEQYEGAPLQTYCLRKRVFEQPRRANCQQPSHTTCLTGCRSYYLAK